MRYSCPFTSWSIRLNWIEKWSLIDFSGTSSGNPSLGLILAVQDPCLLPFSQSVTFNKTQLCNSLFHCPWTCLWVPETKDLEAAGPGSLVVCWLSNNLAPESWLTWVEKGSITIMHPQFFSHIVAEIMYLPNEKSLTQFKGSKGKALYGKCTWPAVDTV